MKKSAHWYRPTGESVHTLPYADKKRAGESRPTTLKDARTLGLLPSVTGILDILDKPQLNDWKLEQMTAEFQRRMDILCGSDNPKDGVCDIAHRDFDALHEDLVERAFVSVEDAADAGEKVHKGAEMALQGLSYDENQPIFLPELKAEFPLKTFLDPIVAFVKDNDIRPTGHEVRIVNRAHGYAGTGDLPMSCRRGVGFLDFKTRKTKAGKPVKAYDTQVMQIAAYHAPHYGVIPGRTDFVTGCNLFVSTTEPGRIEAVWYSAEQVATAYEAFVNACGLWRFMKGYDPRTACL